MQLTGIFRYPVKSFRGESLPYAEVEPWGLRGDRRWMVIDANGEQRTARELHAMLLVRPELVDGGLRLSAADLPPLHVPLPSAEPIPVQVWDSRVFARPAGSEADAWVSKAIGADARLVYLDDPTQRPTNPARTEPGDRVSFADGYPLLLATEESLAALNELIAAGPRAHEGPLPMRRFRPSVVVRGAPAWAEDTWRRIRIGDVSFRAVKGCDRCVMTTVDPDTAIGGKEPIATLARHRRWDGKTWFAINLVPDVRAGDPATIKVGDEIELLEVDETADGPLR